MALAAGEVLRIDHVAGGAARQLRAVGQRRRSFSKRRGEPFHQWNG